jgi:hypothetical protein
MGLGLGGSLCRQIISYYIHHMRYVVQVQDFEVLFQLLDMQQVCSQLWVIAAALTLDLLDDELGVTLHKQLSDPKGQSDA